MRDRQRRRPRRPAPASTRAGTTVRSRMPSTWWFSATGYDAVRAVGRAGDDHAELGVERHALLDHARHAPSSADGARRARPRRSTARWPLPS